MLDLLDYRRQVQEHYYSLRHSSDPATASITFRQAKDELFRHHPQSALTDGQKAIFSGLDYYTYDPAWRVIGKVSLLDESKRQNVELGDDGTATLIEFGRVEFTVPSGDGSLALFWIGGYGGGLFLPLRDATAGKTTYGGGRYLYDTIKGADLGESSLRIDGDKNGINATLLLDFNFAYHPSCAYNPYYVCPLAPPSNHLTIPIHAGEKRITVGSP